MTWSIRYTWPILAYLLVSLFSFIAPTILGVETIGQYRFLLNTTPSILISLGGIYYLFTSPFGESHFLPLTCLIILRFMIPHTTPFNYITGISLYMGSNMAILFFYSLRTLHKAPIRKADYLKLYFLGGIILLNILHYGLSLNLRLSQSPMISEDIFFQISSVNKILTNGLIAALLITHLRMLKKDAEDDLDHESVARIEEIGKSEES